MGRPATGTGMLDPILMLLAAGVDSLRTIRF